MKDYLIERYALSEEGAGDIIKAIKWNILVDFSYILPVILSFYILQKLVLILYGNESNLPKLSIIIISVILILVIMFMVERRKYNLAYTQVYSETAKTRINLAEKLRKLPLAYFGRRDLADLTSTIMNDATELESIYSHAVSSLYSSFISSTILSVLIIIYNWRMALSLLWIIPITFILFSLSRNKIKSEFAKTHRAKLKVTSYFQEGLDSIAEIKAYNYEKKYSNQLNDLLDSYEKILTKEETIGGASINFAYSLLKLGLVSVVIIGAVLFSNNEIDFLTYIAFMIMTSGIYIPLMNSIANMAFITYADIRIDRVKEMNNMEIQTGRTEFNPNSYDIEFKDVEFSYGEGIKVLNGISFKANQNEVTALVGPSGGGKSTTAKLAARFWDIQRGKITMGGEDISKIDPETLLKYYSIVFQDVTLFNNSILENIRVGRKDARDEEVLRVAKLAQCDDIAEKLADGYNTLIGENGEKLSGGERQRISIARAMLKDAPIVILDEATASIDAENETKIQRALSELIKNKTVIVIAHRMRTVRNANKIIVLKDGKIVEMGSPKDLIDMGGIFAEMNKAQLN
ncbi:MAG: ABC transporter ATP-binding protein [Tissierellia bacterium]|nr:ABC transporter ATP-binding protein [Tissierellia bacterium]